MKQRVLAIHPSPTHLAFAVLDGGDLAYLGELPLAEGSRKAARAGADLLLADVRPDLVAVGARRGVAASLSRAVFLVSRRRCRKVLSLSGGAVKRSVAGSGWAGARELAAAVAARMPALRPYRTQERGRAVEALALALAVASLDRA